LRYLQIGRLWVNARYLIAAERWDGTPRTTGITPHGSRVKLADGEWIDLDPEESEDLYYHLSRMTPSGREGRPPGSTTGHRPRAATGSSEGGQGPGPGE
jgi:hypothetical protein